jgi:menaquinone-specific isochorismate synthase
MVEVALDEVAAGRLEKVVAARCLELALDRPVDAVDVLLALRGGGEGTFPYLLEPVPGSFVVGAAPEIVASRRGRHFRATAVAGTVREGADPAESERLARRLLSSDKDRREHRIGVRDMREALLEVAGVAEVDQAPSVLRLQGMQHLSTRLTARLAEDLHVLELLATLHPTAAVNGRPREAALAYLRRREPFDRGWYAGPVGWFDAAGDGAFAPALRSVTAAGRRARVCAGAGLVEGSRPAAEWDETGVKLRPALRALGLDAGPADRAAGIDAGTASAAPGRQVAPAGDSGG